MTGTEDNRFDLLVDGQPFDVYSPSSSNVVRIIDGIFKRSQTAVGIAVDLSNTSLTEKELGNIKARLRAKGLANIQEVICLPT